MGRSKIAEIGWAWLVVAGLTARPLGAADSGSAAVVTPPNPPVAASAVTPPSSTGSAPVAASPVVPALPGLVRTTELRVVGVFLPMTNDPRQEVLQNDIYLMLPQGAVIPPGSVLQVYRVVSPGVAASAPVAAAEPSVDSKTPNPPPPETRYFVAHLRAVSVNFPTLVARVIPEPPSAEQPGLKYQAVLVGDVAVYDPAAARVQPVGADSAASGTADVPEDKKSPAKPAEPGKSGKPNNPTKGAKKKTPIQCI